MHFSRGEQRALIIEFLNLTLYIMPSQLDWLLFIELTFSRVNRAQRGMQKVPYYDDIFKVYTFDVQKAQNCVSLDNQIQSGGCDQLCDKVTCPSIALHIMQALILVTFMSRHNFWT